MQSWLLLLSTVPSDPSAPRVFIWRKLKRLGAILLHDGVWVLPTTDWTREQLQWIAAEVHDLGGEATVYESRIVVGDDSKFVERFLAMVDAAYADIQSQLQAEAGDVAALARRYQQVKAQDYFHSELGERVRGTLLALKGGEDRCSGSPGKT